MTARNCHASRGSIADRSLSLHEEGTIEEEGSICPSPLRVILRLQAQACMYRGRAGKGFLRIGETGELNRRSKNGKWGWRPETRTADFTIRIGKLNGRAGNMDGGNIMEEFPIGIVQ